MCLKKKKEKDKHGGEALLPISLTHVWNVYLRGGFLFLLIAGCQESLELIPGNQIKNDHVAHVDGKECITLDLLEDTGSR